MDPFRSFRYPVSPLEAVVLIRNIYDCPDAENDADRTVAELVREIDDGDGYLSGPVMEAALYCSNLNEENSRKVNTDPEKVKGVSFWHPHEWDFNRFVKNLLPVGKVFNRYYNQIRVKEEKNGPDTKTRR